MDARLRLQKHAENVRIDIDGWESVLDLTWKKIAITQSLQTKQLNMRKQKLIIQYQIEKI